MRDALETLYLFWRRHESAIVALATALAYVVIFWALGALGFFQ